MTATYVTTEPKKLSVLPRDVQVFTFIKAYVDRHGFSPLLDEIARDIGVPRQSIFMTIKRLEKMGCIARPTPRSPRNIVLIKSPVS